MKKVLVAVLVMLFWCNVSFAGCIQGNCKNGQGTWRYDDGAKYVGEFKNGGFFSFGERHGQGTYTYPDGSVVVAIFKKDDFVKIISEDTSAAKKAGCIEGDCQNGFGTKTYPHGKKYVGEFKNGEKHGQGTFYDSIGTKYVGGWKKGYEHGIQTITFSSGQISVIKFKNGAVKKVISVDKSAVDKAKKKMELASMVEDAKKTCKDLGFTEGTDKFSDCSLKLYTLNVESAAKNNQTVVMQPQSSGSNSVTIYDPVRDSNALINKGMRMLSGACTAGVNC